MHYFWSTYSSWFKSSTWPRFFSTRAHEIYWMQTKLTEVGVGRVLPWQLWRRTCCRWWIIIPSTLRTVRCSPCCICPRLFQRLLAGMIWIICHWCWWWYIFVKYSVDLWPRLLPNRCPPQARRLQKIRYNPSRITVPTPLLWPLPNLPLDEDLDNEICIMPKTSQ